MTTTPLTPQLIDLARRSPGPQDLLTEYELRALFAHIICDATVARQAAAELRQDVFPEHTEPHWRLLCGVIGECWRQFHNLTPATLRSMIEIQLTYLEPGLARDACQRLLEPGGLLSACESCRPNQLDPAYGTALLKRLLLERTIAGPLCELLQRRQGGAVAELLESAQTQMRRIDSLSSPPMPLVMPQRGSPLPPPDVLVPTGIPYIDRYIIGQRAGDCNGILGVFASGKTTLFIDLTVSNAWNFFLTASAGARPKVSVLITYEEPAFRIEKRVWANAARIRQRKLVDMLSWNELTTRDNREPYEANLPMDVPNREWSESERWDATAHWLNQSFILLDLSGSANHPGAGTGYVDEIVTLLERIRRERGVEIGAVQIDYARLMCVRHMHARNIGEDRLRHYVGNLGEVLRREVAVRFGCTVWLAHQIAPAENRRASTTAMHHSHAAESKAFAENMAVCGCLGVPDPDTGCIRLTWSKIRYQPSTSIESPILRIDGDFCRLVEVSDAFVADPVSRSFVDRETAHAIQGHDRSSNHFAYSIDPEF